MRPINEIVVHCSATRPGWKHGAGVLMKAEEIRRWHMEGKGWSDIGYHFVIDRDGSIAPGRDIETRGAHTRGRNNESIGVCLIGGHGSQPDDAFDRHFTQAQDAALRALIQGLRREHRGIAMVSGHNEYAAKACPGFNVRRWYGRAKPRNPIMAALAMLFGRRAA